MAVGRVGERRGTGAVWIRRYVEYRQKTRGGLKIRLQTAAGDGGGKDVDG
jgi:hypothetical protein